MMPLHHWLSRALALMLLAAGIGIPVIAVVVPVSNDYAATKTRIADAALALGRYRQIGERLPRQRAALAALEQQPGRQVGFLPGSNETLIGAELQNRVKTIVEAAQGQLRSTQVLPPREDGGFREIPVRVEMTAELPAAQAILYQIEAASPLLFLDNVDLRAHPADRRDGSDDDPPLDVSFEVYGYVRAQR
jgi:general secretion pathway protein M